MQFLKAFDDFTMRGFPGSDLTRTFHSGMRPIEPLMGWDMRFDTADSAFVLPLGRGWTNDALNLRVSMPAVAKEDFTVSRMGNLLTIRGERKAPVGFGRDGMADFALRYGPFERSVDLPAGLDLDKLQAKFHHGVLDIHIPILSEARARVIPVEVGDEFAFAVAAA